MQLREYIEQLVRRFEEADLTFGHGTANTRDEAVYLVYATLDIDFETAVDSLERPLGEDERRRLDALAARRIRERVPVAYLVGKAWFAGHPFYCDQRAIIPRSPIAELIVNEFQPLLAGPPRRILDLCAGSGCIGIACALQFPESRVELSDISRDCLDLARDNIKLHGVEERVQSCQSDLFAGLQGRYDLIVSNPPYVSAEEVAALPREYRHEPAQALLSDENGLAIPLQILRQAGAFLSDNGVLILEVGGSAERLQARLPRLPLLWLDFEDGGDGVLALSARQLAQYSEFLN